MRRVGIVTAVVLTALAPSATAAPATVDATDRNTFEPSEVTVNVGEAVTWRFGLLRPHYVESDIGAAEVFNSSPDPTAPMLRARANPPGSTWPLTFTKPGRFSYNCPIHVAVGMKGVVNVVAPAPPAAQAPSVTAGNPPAPAADTLAPRIAALRARRGRRDLAVRLRLSEAARITGLVESVRPRRTVRRFSVRKRGGSTAIRLSTRRLRPGRYLVVLTATDAAGNRSGRARSRFTVASR